MSELTFEDLKVGDNFLMSQNRCIDGKDIWQETILNISPSGQYIQIQKGWFNIKEANRNWGILEKLKSLPIVAEKMITHIPKW